MSALKEILRHVLYLTKRKSYKIKTNPQTDMATFPLHTDFESFFGYYDHSPEQNGKVLYHIMRKGYVEIHVSDIQSGKDCLVGRSRAFNWQMGSRALWIDNDTISWNDFDGEKYVCKWFSVSRMTIIRVFDYPLQDFYRKDYFLGVNYQRLRSYAKEYAYYCLPALEEKVYADYANDGIWRVNPKNDVYCLLVSIKEVLECNPSSNFIGAKHFVNHVMIAPSGKAFIFIHRYYKNGVRYDRLMHYDFNKLTVLLADKIESHFCWINDSQVFGYGQHEGRSGFYTIDTNTLSVKYHKELTDKHPRDGHPTCAGQWIVIDNYPDLSRQQSLIAYNMDTLKTVMIGSFFHDLKHKGFDRCDLHPRFTDDGKSVYIDTIYTGKRQLCRIELNGLLS